MRPTLFKAFALFVVVCAAVFLAFTNAPSDTIVEEAPRTPLERALSSLESTQRAKRAMDAANYGIVSRELSRLEGELTEMIGTLSESRVSQK